MPGPVLITVLAHHGEAADPDLLQWIKGVLDHVLGSGPWLASALLGLLVLAMPVGIVVFYLTQQRRSRTDHRQSDH